jgi:hypothetical protein
MGVRFPPLALARANDEARRLASRIAEDPHTGWIQLVDT